MWTTSGPVQFTPDSPHVAFRVHMKRLLDAQSDLYTHLKRQMAKHFRSGDVSFPVFEARFMKSFFLSDMSVSFTVKSASLQDERADLRCFSQRFLHVIVQHLKFIRICQKRRNMRVRISWGRGP